MTEYGGVYMFFTERKAHARINDLFEYRYRDRIELAEWQFTEDAGEIGTYPPEETSPDTKDVQIGDRWEGRDLYAWFSKKVSIPKEWPASESLVGVFDFGDTGGGNNSGFESLLFLDSTPYQGVDTNHKEVFLPEDKRGGQVAFDFRLWSGLEGGGMPQNQEFKFKRADLAWFDSKVDAYYYDARAVIETVDILSEERPERHQLLQALNHSLNMIDWLEPGSETFYESVYAAGDYLKTEMENMEKHHDVVFHCIGHTHIDVAWLWQLKHTREKSARSFSTVLRLMEQYPEYLFLQTQPQLYEYIQQDYPELYQQMKDRIKEGRWEAEGGMWLEADCNIPSGESLVRQLLLGSNFLREEFGKETEYLWLPDVFGYSWALPQILKKSGIDTFMTTKISWSQYNRMPHDTFHWRGIDGSEILTHFITTTEPWPESTYYTYNGYITPQVVKESWDAYKDKSINQDLILSYGYGDGGGGVNRDMLEMRKRIDAMPGLPHAKASRADEYFRKLHDTIEQTEGYVHTWDGELYLEFHRGTYTSQAEIKRMNRRLELLYRETEWLNVLQGLKQNAMDEYPQEELTKGWKIILRNQFHDIIPGSSIYEVYQDAQEEHREAESYALEAWDTASQSFIQKEAKGIWTVFNSAAWKRQETLVIPNKEKGTWRNHQGEELESQSIADGYIVNVKDIPAMGYATIYFEKTDANQTEASPFVTQRNRVETPYYIIVWNEAGQLTQLFDKANQREVLKEEESGNVLQVFEDKPMMFDAWDIDIYYQEKMTEVTNLTEVNVVESGALETIIRFTWKYGASTINQDMIVYARSPRIDFKTHVDWQERQRLLKVAFPVDVRATEATYDIQYGNVKRPTHWNTSWDLAMFETVGHQWADLSEGGYGVSLLNDSKYGYDIKNHTIRLSLLKSPIHPDPYADQGHHTFTYALLPHTASWEDGNTVREAWQLNNPLTLVEGEAENLTRSLFDCTTDHVMIDAVKKAEYSDQVIIRLHEFEGKRGEVSLQFNDWPISTWQECDLMERPISDEQKQQSLTFNIKPYEIKTFAVTFS